MDNIENDAPQGEADVTASSGQSGEDTQPVEAPAETVEANDEAETTETEAESGESSYPWEADEKFKGKTPDDIFRSYKELEKAQGSLGQKAEIANLLEEKFGVTPEQLKAQIAQQETAQKKQRYADNPLAPVIDEVQELKQIVQNQEHEKALANEEKELDSFLADNPDYQPYRDKILKLGLTSEQDKPFDEIAREWFGESRAQGQQDAYKKIDTKKMTQATGAQSAPQRKFTEEELNNMTSEELEAILPHADTSHRPY